MKFAGKRDKHVRVYRRETFLKHCCWGFWSSGMWCCVVGLMFAYVSKTWSIIIATFEDSTFFRNFEMASYPRRANNQFKIVIF